MNIHVVLDMETFGTRPNAMVFAIGMTCNDGHSYYAELPTCGQGRRVDMATIEWWDKQPEGPNKEIFKRAWNSYGAMKTPVDREHDWNFCRAVLIEVAGYIKEKKERAQKEGGEFFFWGNSPSFDQAILENMMDDFTVQQTWDYRDVVDVRTIRKLYGGKIETTHHALEDAKLEYVYLCEKINIGNL